MRQLQRRTIAMFLPLLMIVMRSLALPAGSRPALAAGPTLAHPLGDNSAKNTSFLHQAVAWR